MAFGSPCSVWLHLVLTGVVIANTNPSPQYDNPAIQNAVESVFPALVRLDVVVTRPMNGRIEKRRLFGSGVIISRQGYVVTNHHVAGQSTRIVCRLTDGQEVKAHLVGTDPLSDIAVIQMDLTGRRSDAPLVAAQFGDSKSIYTGQTVFAMGSQAALSQSVTRGIISNKAMILPRAFRRPGLFELERESVGSLVRWIGHDAAIFDGNSGGPLVDESGRIIGINEIAIGSLGGAIPGDLAAQVAKQLIETGRVQRSWVGLQCQPRLKSQEDVSGVLVGTVFPESPAQRSGIRAGDIITHYDGVAVDCALDEDLPLFNGLMLATPVGKEIMLKLLRQGQPVVCTLTTVTRERIQQPAHELKAWGMTVRDLTRVNALEKHRLDKKAVLVDSIRPGGPASQAEPPLLKGDILVSLNQIDVQRVSKLKTVTEEILSEASGPVAVLAGLERKGQHLLSVVDIGFRDTGHRTRYARKAWLPIKTQVLARDLAEALGLKGKTGVRITEIFAGRSAEKAGLKVGDVVLKLDGERIAASQVQDREVFAQMVRQYKIGTVVTLDVIRDGNAITIDVALEAPVPQISEMKTYQDKHLEWTLRELAFEDRVGLQIEDEQQGVLVARVDASGWAALAGIRGNDLILTINGTPTPDLQTAQRLLEQVEQDKQESMVVFLARGIRRLFTEIETSW
jgi:serine protease Do